MTNLADLKEMSPERALEILKDPGALAEYIRSSWTLSATLERESEADVRVGEDAKLWDPVYVQGLILSVALQDLHTLVGARADQGERIWPYMVIHVHEAQAGEEDLDILADVFCLTPGGDQNQVRTVRFESRTVEDPENPGWFVRREWLTWGPEHEA